MRFADATCGFKRAKFCILGVPFDLTSSFRAGTKEAPKKIREYSYNYEPWLQEHGIDLRDAGVHDAGNVISKEGENLVGVVEEKTKWVFPRVPVLLGGEHTLTIGSTRAFEDFSVVIMDAHLDFRSVYEGEKYSHACVTRRVFERVGAENLVVIGVRSWSREEEIAVKKLGLKYVEAQEVKVKGIERVVPKLRPKIYLSIDMDVFDPCYAPGVSNPVPFGLSVPEVVRCTRLLAGKLIGCDLCEISPPHDNGTTSLLGAWLIRDLIGSIASSQNLSSLKNACSKES